MPGGRPTKLNDKLIEAMEEVLSDDIKVVALTDKELIETINYKLDEKDQIAVRTFEEYKAGNREGNPVMKEFMWLYKKAYNKQKQNLIARIMEDDKAWQRFSWIMERKFTDWNMRKIVIEDKRLVVGKEGLSDEAMKEVSDLLDSI